GIRDQNSSAPSFRRPLAKGWETSVLEYLHPLHHAGCPILSPSVGERVGDISVRTPSSPPSRRVPHPFAVRWRKGGRHQCSNTFIPSITPDAPSFRRRLAKGWETSVFEHLHRRRHVTTVVTPGGVLIAGCPILSPSVGERVGDISASNTFIRAITSP